jgi:hypothetical protein
MKVLPQILALLAFMPLMALQAQESSPAAKSDAAPSKRTDVYHVFVVKAAPGKAKELADWLKQSDPAHPDAKRIVLRHQEGDSWDYIEIEHEGAKATVDMNGTPLTPAQRMLMDWHNDTFVAGPSWSDFAKAMGIDGDSGKANGAIYVVSDYRAAPGHRDEMEKMLNEPTPGDTAAGMVLFAHLEGAEWNFLGVVRYDSWDKFAESEKSSFAATQKGEGGWFDLRNHVACHHDTLADRILP